MQYQHRTYQEHSNIFILKRVNEKLKIGISGSHSTGKTTFIKQIEKALKNLSIEFKTISDLATICPLPILRNHTIESTLWIATKGITEEIEAEHKFSVVIVDRPILDCWAYFNAVCQNKYEQSDTKLLTLKNIIINWIPTYHFIYQTVIDNTIKIESKKGRDLDKVYRNKIGDEMTSASKLFGISPRKLTSSNTNIELEFLLKRIILRTQ